MLSVRDSPYGEYVFYTNAQVKSLSRASFSHVISEPLEALIVEENFFLHLVALRFRQIFAVIFSPIHWA